MKLQNILFALVSVLVIAGCTNLKFEWKASYKTDNLIEDLERNK